jgi:hypothetical protein
VALSEEHKRKISIAHKALNKVVIISAEQKEAISKALTGNTHGKANKGRVMSDEQKQKLSITHTGKELSVEHRTRIAESHKGSKNAFYGKQHNTEMRAKISQRTKEGMAKRKEANLIATSRKNGVQ